MPPPARNDRGNQVRVAKVMDDMHADGAPTGGFTRNDVYVVLLLAAVAVGLRTWQLTHTTVASRDSIGYVRIAWRLEHGDWRKVLPHAAQHPLYPAAVLLVSHPVRRFLPDDLPFAMQLSAQLTSAIASVLFVLPMFLLGRELFDRRTAFGGTLLFQCLPASGRVLGDGLSEALFLLCSAWALYWAAFGLRGRSWQPFALAGLASGFAYLTRPEGLLIAAMTGVVLVVAQAVPHWRRSRRQLLLSGTGLALGALIVGGPYMRTIGGLTVKQAANRVMAKGITQANDVAAPDRRLASLGAGLPLFAEFIDGNPDLHKPSERVFSALVTLGNVLIRGFFWSAWLPALVGLWVCRDRFHLVPGIWVGMLLCGLIAFLLYRVGVVVGYLSDRHLLLVLLFGCYWAAAGMPALAAGLAALVGRLWPRWRNLDVRIATAVLLLVFCGGPLFRTLEPLHADRAGFRQAGYWLGAHAWSGDKIDDAYAWANYYAGHVFTEVDPADGLPFAPGPAQEPTVRYVVLEVSANKHPRLQTEQPADLMAAGGRVEQSWRLTNRKDDGEVVVYVVPVKNTKKN